jgi:hypothetical protein
MKQTAIDWLLEQMASPKFKYGDVTDRNEIIRQAKEMNRNQTISFASDFAWDYGLNPYENPSTIYDQTFNC